MSTAKSCAQVAHASVLAYVHTQPGELKEKWLQNGHYTKVILLAEDELQLTNIDEYLRNRGIRTDMVIDEGRTEVRPFTKTALGCEIVDKNDERIQEIFGEFQIYKELPKSFLEDEENIKNVYTKLKSFGHLNRKGQKVQEALH